MYRIQLRLLSMVLFAFVILAGGKQAQTDSTEIQVSRSNQDSIAFAFHSAEPAISDGTVYIPGIEQSIATPGQPALPYYTALIALPPMADANVSVTPGELQTQLVTDIAPVGTPRSPEGRPEDLGISGIEALGLDLIPDEAIYGNDAQFPASWYEVSEPQQSRDLRFVSVNIYPVRYNPVSGELVFAPDMQFDVTFSGGLSNSGEQLKTRDQLALAEQTLNADEARGWSFIPSKEDSGRATTVTLPVSSQALKIEVDANGIYELSYADLQSAGLTVTGVNPTNIEMMHRGESVAFQFVGDNDASFESGEKIRFYGWKFDGPRDEKQYVVNNVFWLWVDGSASNVASVANPTGYNALSSFRATHTEEPENSFSAGYTDKWHAFPNDADNWFWDQVSKTVSGSTPTTGTFNVPLQNPAASGSSAEYTVEVMTGFESSHNIHLDVNGERKNNNVALGKLVNENISGTVPQSALLDGDNQFDIVLDTSGKSSLWLNRITVEYWAQFIAENNTLEYRIENAGNNEVVIDGFSSNAGLVAWDISDRLNPVAILVSASDRSGNGPYSYRIARSNSVDSSFIAVSETAVKAPVSLSTYMVEDIQPANGADWLAISYPAFRSEVDKLATHRQNTSGLTTHVVDSDDLINQYGYGLPIPDLLANYIAEGVTDWATPLKYVVLAGDATNNARQLDCTDQPWCGSNWVANETVYVPTFLKHVDRILGMIPTDHGYAAVIGDDLIPDVAVGRLPAQSASEMKVMVDKIILYEDNLDIQASWANDIIFVSDNNDTGGQFCNENRNTSVMIPANYDVSEYCIATGTTADETAIHSSLMNAINNTGFLIVNYRGHGGINKWATSLLLDTADIATMTNAERPFVVLSADCLDGHFTWVNRPGMSETFLGREGGGAAAHWGSTGLGYTFEHTILHASLTEAVFGDNVTRIGDAVNVSKGFYIANDQDESEVWAFTLQGDPAMDLVKNTAPTAVGLDSAESILPSTPLLPAAILIVATLTTLLLLGASQLKQRNTFRATVIE